MLAVSARLFTVWIVWTGKTTGSVYEVIFGKDIKKLGIG